ncbi:MAG: lysylphosphatidylglycerol synthase transmembrane domain-containing protein [Gemmobacter sp.]
MSARHVLRWVLALALLAAVWVFADGAAAWARLAAADPVWLLAAFLALHAQTLLSALRWRVTARGLGLGLAPGRSIREYYMGQIVNQILPGGIPGDAARALRLAEGGRLGPAAASVVVERLAGQIAMFGALAAGLGVALVLPAALDWPPGLRPVLGLGLGGLVLLAALGLMHPGRWAATGRDALRRGLAGPGVLRAHLALGGAILALNLAAFAFAARATGTALPPLAVLSLVPLILTAMLVPLSIGGWGWREGAAAILFPVAGASAAAGLAASAAFGALILLAAVPGVFFLTRPHTEPCARFAPTRPPAT